VMLLPPLAPENKVVCVGINYRKKYPLQGVPPPGPDHIILFAKHHDAMVGPGALCAQRLHQGITMVACANV
jgi:2-keto-4-pentenoate hydratase/2-oxohepta-3-ene-1,7-dioic acid hydratase in catechol pathway